MANAWMTHLKKYKNSHPGMSLTEAMKGASKTYKKQRGGGELTHVDAAPCCHR